MRLPTLLVLATLSLCGCDMVQVYQGQIDRATRTIEEAKTDGARASAYAERGRAYSNKARLSLVRHQIDRAEYLRLFDLAIADHDAADKLAPSDAEVAFQRGLTDYDRAAMVEDLVEIDHQPWFDAARSAFESTVRLHPGHAVAYDYLGLVEEQTGRFDEAISAYTHVMAFDRKLGRSRLGDLYCNRGQAYLRDKSYDLAATELEKSTELVGAADGCSCEPFNSLAAIYVVETAQYDKGWDLVRRARDTGHFIAPEYIDRLTQATGRKG